jgi:dolichol-phosphate mannosyltransferase
MKTRILTIVIPVRSESETLPETIHQLQKTVKTPCIILVVDDHIDPKDKTPKIAKALTKTYRNVAWLPKTATDADGFGPALTRAVETIQTPFTAFVMGDGCDDARAIDQMMRTIKKTKADVIVGSRYISGGKKVGGPWLQHIFSFLLNKFLFRLGLHTTDATNAFKLYKTSFLRSILPKKPFPGVEFSLQLSIEGYQKHGNYYEIPTTWVGRTKGNSKFKLLRNGRRYLTLAWRALRV